MNTALKYLIVKPRGGRLTLSQQIIALNPIQYLPLTETSGSTFADASGNARDASFWGITAGGATFTDGNPAPLFNANGLIDLYSASLSSAFNGNEGSFAVWVNPTWNAAAHSIVKLGGASNRFIELAQNTSDRFVSYRFVDGVNDGVQIPYTPALTWEFVVFRWSDTADVHEVIIDGVSEYSTTPIGTWTGGLSADYSVLGAYSTSFQQPYVGSMAHFALFDYWLTDANIAAIYAAGA